MKIRHMTRNERNVLLTIIERFDGEVDLLTLISPTSNGFTEIP